MDEFTTSKFSDVMQEFGQANSGNPILWVAWLVLFLLLFLAVRWDARRQKKEDEELRRIHEE